MRASSSAASPRRRPGRAQVEQARIPRGRDGADPKFGFVHFRERVGAMHAVEDVERPELDGNMLNVSAAREGQLRGQGGWGEWSAPRPTAACPA